MNDWQTILAIDADKWAAATYAANFPGVRVECGKVMDFIDEVHAPDCVIGGAPCQPFSLAGERKGSDDERDCIPDFIAWIEKHRPRQFLLEQVPGFLSFADGRYAQKTFTLLEDAGYRVDVKTLDAVNFGVPQFRERVWFWGIRNGIEAKHRWPRPTHTWPAAEPCMFGGALPTAITVRQALGLDGALRRSRGKGMAERHGERRDHPTSEPAPIIPAGCQGSGPRLLFVQSHADPAQTVDKPSPTLRSGGNGHDGCCLRVLGGGRNDARGADGNFVRRERDITDEPCTTITGKFMGTHTGAQNPRVVMEMETGSKCRIDHNGNARGPLVKDIDNPAFTIDSRPPDVRYRWSDEMLQKHPPASPDEPCPTIQAKWFKGGAEGLLAVTKWKQKGDLWVRRLTPLECLRLQSGPDDFRWPEGISKTNAYRIIGNGWASGIAAQLSRALKAADPYSETVIDLFCGGGLGAVGWHQRYWQHAAESEAA